MCIRDSTKIEDQFVINSTIEAKLIKVDTEERKIALSIREHRQDLEREQIETFNQTQEVPEAPPATSPDNSPSEASSD